MLYVSCFTVWCSHTTGATVGEEVDRTSDKPNSQVRGSPSIAIFFRDVKAACSLYINTNLLSLSVSHPILFSHSTSAMSLLYECVNTVIAGQYWYSVAL